jgi:enoyl-CoA hydratase
MVRRLEEVLQATDADDGIRTVLISGRGRAFSAGGDLKGYVELRRDQRGFTEFLEGGGPCSRRSRAAYWELEWLEGAEAIS